LFDDIRYCYSWLCQDTSDYPRWESDAKDWGEPLVGESMDFAEWSQWLPQTSNPWFLV